MTEVKFYDCSFDPGVPLTYSVISARYMNKWIFVRHNDRDTFEIPAGHIEPGETSGETARREFMEETGAINFRMECISTYSVQQNDYKGWGRLYFAEVTELGPVPDIIEIAEVIMLDRLPENLTYPEVQRSLFEKVIKRFS